MNKNKGIVKIKVVNKILFRLEKYFLKIVKQYVKKLLTNMSCKILIPNSLIPKKVLERKIGNSLSGGCVDSVPPAYIIPILSIKNMTVNTKVFV